MATLIEPNESPDPERPGDDNVPVFRESDIAAQIDAIRISINTALILLELDTAGAHDEKLDFLGAVLAQAQQAISVARFTAFPPNEQTSSVHIVTPNEARGAGLIIPGR
jgi:hypothetical protein